MGRVWGPLKKTRGRWIKNHQPTFAMAVLLSVSLSFPRFISTSHLNLMSCPLHHPYSQFYKRRAPLRTTHARTHTLHSTRRCTPARPNAASAGAPTTSSCSCGPVFRCVMDEGSLDRSIKAPHYMVWQERSCNAPRKRCGRPPSGAPPNGAGAASRGCRPA